MWFDWNPDIESFEEAKIRRRQACPRLTANQLEALWQLRMTISDGYVISKTLRDQLVKMGLAERLNGWQFITREGMAVLDTYGLLRDSRYGTKPYGDKLWTLTADTFAILRQEGWLK